MKENINQINKKENSIPTNESEYCPIPKYLYNALNYLGLIPDPNDDTREYNVGESDYAQHIIQPWTIWLAYPDLNPWDADIIKRVLRTKNGEARLTDYRKIIHICQERIRQINTNVSY